MRISRFRRKRYSIIVFSAMAATLFTLGFVLFCWQISRVNDQTARASLDELVIQQSAEVSSTFTSYMNTLDVMSGFFLFENTLKNQNILLRCLQILQNNSRFNTVFYSDLSGHSVNNRGEIFDISNTEFFIKAKSGIRNICANQLTPVTGTKVVVFAIPVYNRFNGITSVIGATCPVSYLNEVFRRSFNGNGRAFVVDGSNNLVVQVSKSAIKEEELNLVYDLWSQGEAKHEYKYKNERFYFRHVQLPINNWTLVSVVPAQIIHEQTSRIRAYALLQTLFNLGVVVLLVLIIVVSYARYTTEVTEIAYKDALTGGITLQKFMQDADIFMKNNSGKTLLALCVDINNFRIINDIYGFDEGSMVLRWVYNALGEYLDNAGIYCRVANDIFYILAKGSGQNLNAIFNPEGFNDFFNKELVEKKKNYHLTFAVGLYQVEDTNIGAAIAFERANHVHNMAKKAGTGHLLYQEDFRKSAIQQKLIENSMREAFENFEFKMYLQPKYELSSKKLIGAEALIRWESLGSNKKYPDEFIPVFEKTGFIVQVDLFMMECACQRLRQWIDEGHSPVAISVNQSKSLLLSPFYFNVITATIEKYNLPPRLIEIEVTETIMYDNAAELNLLISRIHDYGMRVAIDDFGSGYSSLVLLRDIRADVLKIDKAFIYKAEQDVVGKKILTSIIQLADALNMQILAEGIETEAQAEMLVNLGCHVAQGYLYGRPVAADRFFEENPSEVSTAI